MDCSICLEPLISNQDFPMTIQFCCKQQYHFHCIKRWSDENHTCPICRRLLDQTIITNMRKIENNFKEIKERERRAQHIIETLMHDIELLKQRTNDNIQSLNMTTNFIRPVIPPTPRIHSRGNFDFLRYHPRRNALVYPSILDDCIFPSFCRCGHCLPGPRWH